MKLKPVTLINHRDDSALDAATKRPQHPQVAKAYAYQILVTRHGMAPDKAKQLLGLSV